MGARDARDAWGGLSCTFNIDLKLLTKWNEDCCLACVLRRCENIPSSEMLCFYIICFWRSLYFDAHTSNVTKLPFATFSISHSCSSAGKMEVNIVRNFHVMIKDTRVKKNRLDWLDNLRFCVETKRFKSSQQSTNLTFLSWKSFWVWLRLKQAWTIQLFKVNSTLF